MSAVEGQWASDGGQFVASFDKGRFTNVNTANGEVVADGRYAATADGYQVNWVSLVRNEQRSATCRFVTAARLSCTPPQGAPFVLTKVG